MDPVPLLRLLKGPIRPKFPKFGMSMQSSNSSILNVSDIPGLEPVFIPTGGLVREKRRGQNSKLPQVTNPELREQ